MLINIFFNVEALWSALRSLHVDQRGGEGISLEGRGGGRGGIGKEGKGRHMETSVVEEANFDWSGRGCILA